jgi:hypothetical protein
MSTAIRLAQEAQGIFEQADKEGRTLTGDERIYVENLLERSKESHELERKFQELDGSLGRLNFLTKDANITFRLRGSRRRVRQEPGMEERR